MYLYIFTENEDLRSLLEKQRDKHRNTDSGFDIPMSEQMVNMFYETTEFNFGIKVACLNQMREPMPCLLLPRSSLAKSPFRLANSIGLIDMGYRGDVRAMVDIYSHGGDPFIRLDSGTRLFQICRNDFLPWSEIHILDKESDLPSPPDSRGAGGFGSTN